jgi:CheY-like chemotaxis protein
MAPKCALIVDDSRTARQVLGNVLSANRLRVETAASAEAALEYLRHSRPDVIFMDHNMPGMDGLQAVQAIKSNPATATIPIMMYTSQEGELYVGQARALGAVGVLPKQIKPVEVTDVLRSLHLIDADAAGLAAATAPGESMPPPGKDFGAEINSRDWSDLNRWLQEMFEHHGAEIRTDVEATVARVLREQAQVRGSEESTPAPSAARARSPWTTLLVGALTMLAGVFFWLHLETQRKWQAAVEQNVGLMASLSARRSVATTAAADTARQLSRARDEFTSRYAELIAALEWGVNQSATYPAGGEPFGDQRLEVVKGLLERLAEAGFTGTVRLDSHVGDFCYAALPAGEPPVLADDAEPAERCERIGLSAEEARRASARESVAFANFIGARLGDPAIRIEIVPHGNAMPAVPYPAGPQGLSAGEWNAFARQNNRVTVTLLPDGAGG